jgi:hypothetical protein
MKGNPTFNSSFQSQITINKLTLGMFTDLNPPPTSKIRDHIQQNPFFYAFEGTE